MPKYIVSAVAVFSVMFLLGCPINLEGDAPETYLEEIPLPAGEYLESTEERLENLIISQCWELCPSLGYEYLGVEYATETKEDGTYSTTDPKCLCILQS